MQEERSRPSKEGQRREPKSEPSGEQTCQVWGMVGSAEPLSSQKRNPGGSVSQGRQSIDLGRWDWEGRIRL